MTKGSKVTTAAASEVAPAMPSWLPWTAAAMAATMTHTMIDMHIGLWGESSQNMGVFQAANAFGTGLVYAWWLIIVYFALRGTRWGLRALFIMSVFYPFLSHGAVAFVAAPPPSAAFPYQDIAHGLSLLTGGMAALRLWPFLGTSTQSGNRNLLVTTIVLVVAQQSLGSLVFFREVVG